MRVYSDSDKQFVWDWLKQARLDWPNPTSCVPAGPVATLVIALRVLIAGTDKTVAFPDERERLLMWAIDTANSIPGLFGEESEPLAVLLRDYRRRDLKSH